MELNIVCIPGDGIGPEIVNEAQKVLNLLVGICQYFLQGRFV